MTPNTLPTRPVTRSLFARFANTSSRGERPSTTAPASAIPDIEDAVTAGTTRKRKRTTVTTEDGVDGTQSSPQKIKTEEVTGAAVKTPSTPRRVRKPARKTVDPETNVTTVAPPSDWEEMYDLVKKMRLTGPAAHAAVDTMGCERLADTKASPKDQRFHTLVALMLSSQTKDTTTAVAMKRLQTELPPHKEGAPVGLNVENMLAVDPAKLNELIWAVGFHNNKTKYLKRVAEILRDQWGGDIPDTLVGLTSLPGVGPKMAHLCMSAAWGKTEGIGVDVHVHRITNMWGWNKTKNPEETRKALEAWLPRDKWREINWLLVGFGQTVCLPVGKKCGECELGLNGLCKAAERAKVIQARKAREVKVDIDAGLGFVKKEQIEEVVVKDVVVNEDVNEERRSSEEKNLPRRPKRIKLETE